LAGQLVAAPFTLQLREPVLVVEHPRRLLVLAGVARRSCTWSTMMQR
jgi:hypothetical protein